MADRRPAPAWLPTAIDAGPGLLWLVVALVQRDFFIAVWVAIGASLAAIAVGLVALRKISPVPAVTLALAVIFGGASVYFHRADIYQMKMTIVDGIFGAVLFVGVIRKKNPLKTVLGSAMTLPDHAWRTLTIRYGLFFWACAIANEVVRRTQTIHVWTLFRAGAVLAIFAFALAQTPFLMKHNQVAEPAEPKA